MIDLHCHILPRVDDGSFSMEESLKMARLAVDSGVTDIVTTPHANVPDSPHPLWGEEAEQVLRRLRTALEEAGIPLRVYPGMEIFGQPDVPELLARGKLITLNHSRYPLVEFPFHGYAAQATEILGELLDMGYRPVVAHPERYSYIQKDPELVNILFDMGCLLQINRGSLFGRFGPEAERTAYGLLERNFVAAVSSDAHRSDVRTPWLEDVRRLISREFSPERAGLLLHDRARKIIDDEEIILEEPDWF